MSGAKLVKKDSRQPKSKETECARPRDYDRIDNIASEPGFWIGA